MGDSDLSRLIAVASVIARRSGAWSKIVATAFKRDVTCFDWRLNGVLDDLGVVHRSYPSMARVPGRVAVAKDGKDAPDGDVLEDFLARGGTLIVEGDEVFERLALKARKKWITGVGGLAVKGPAIDALALRVPAAFWVEDRVFSYTIPKAKVLVAAERTPLVSAVRHLGGTVVVFATSVYSFQRESASKIKATTRAFATELGITVGDARDPLGRDDAFPRDLLVAETAMAGVLGHVIASALSAS